MTEGRTRDQPELLSADAALPIHELEPERLVATFQAVCSELLGPCQARVFTFADPDGKRLASFGVEEEPPTFLAPEIGADGLFAWNLSPINEPKIAGEGFGAVLPLNVQGEGIGILQLTFVKPLEPSEVVRLGELKRTLAVAVRNARTFEKTKRLTFTDDLTALYNARFMALYLDRELKRCRRTRSSLSLLFMDLDGFKSINDTHGHLAGSRTLIEVGEVLEKTVRDADVLIRYGGDEFVILFPETPLSGGLIIAERIRQVIGATPFLRSQQIEARVSASIGIAAYPESADDVRGLIGSADRAMYEAKALGKNRVVSATPFRPSESPQRGPSN